MVETVVVVFATLLILGIGFLKWDALYGGFRKLGLARMIVGDVLFAREEAIRLEKRQAMVFGATSYQIQDHTGRVILDSNHASPRYEFTFTSIPFAGNTLFFDKIGIPSEGGTFTLAFRGEGVSFYLDPVLARVIPPASY